MSSPAIFLIEQNEGHSLLIKERFLQAFPQADLQHARTFHDASQKLCDGTWDLVIINSQLPDGRAIDVLNHLSSTQPFAPVVILTEDPSEELEAQTNHHGPIEFLTKDRQTLDSFIFRVKRLMAAGRQIHHLFQGNEREINTTLRDSLTQVYNRDFFEESLRHELSRANRYGQEFAVLAVDVDHFRKLVKKEGCRGGDECLRKLASILDQSVRAGDIVARYQTDKFVILLTQCRAADAVRCANRVMGRIKKLSTPFTISMGILHYRGIKKYRPEQIISLAEHAVGKAKSQGGDRYIIAA